MLSNCDAREGSWETLGLQGDQTNKFQRKSTLNIRWKDDAEAEAPILWPPVSKSQLTGKDSDVGKDWGQEEKEAAEGELVRQNHQLNGHESEQTLRDNGRQRSLECFGPGGHKKSDMCTPMAESYWCLTETTKFCKAIILQLKNKLIFKKSDTT